MPSLVQHPLGEFLVWPDAVGRDLQRGGFWDEHLKLPIQSGDPAGTALDLGASIGFLTVYLAKRYSHVLAVEAHPTTYKLLIQNLQLNRVGNVTPIWGAAYDAGGYLRMGTEAEQGWTLPSQWDLDGAVCASGVAFRPTEGAGLHVPCFPIDWCLPPTRKVSFIKVDVQGCDLRALRGLQQTIDRWRPRVVYEYESISKDWHGDPIEDYTAFFTSRNYRVSQIHPNFQDYFAEPQ